MSNITIDPDPRENSYRVVLPCSPDDFAEFVSSILGKGLTIDKTFPEAFDLSTSNLEQLFHLFVQRSQQNSGKLVSFSAKIYYTDKSTASFNSPEDYFSHNEVKKLTTGALTWELVFLIHFPGHKVPEKQVIAIRWVPGFVAESSADSYRAQRYSDLRPSEISIQIAHSEKTWANDVLNLFRDFLSNHLVTTARRTHLWNTINEYLGGFAGYLCFGIGLVGIIFGYRIISEKRLEVAAKALTNSEESIKYLVHQSNDPTMVYFFVASLFYVSILALVSGKLSEKFSGITYLPPRSWLRLTSEDVRIADAHSKHMALRAGEIGTELGKGILLGIIGNAVFAGIAKLVG